MTNIFFPGWLIHFNVSAVLTDLISMQHDKLDKRYMLDLSLLVLELNQLLVVAF